MYTLKSLTLKRRSSMILGLKILRLDFPHPGNLERLELI
jgi:hypothetical protein